MLFLLQIYIKEIDKFAQHGLEFFRGHAQFWLVDEVEEIIPGDEENEPTTKMRDEKTLICELPVVLPKV